MAWVTEDLIEVWKSGTFVGAHTPAAVVQVQLGHWIRGWFTEDTVVFPPVRAKIWGEGGYGPYDPQPGHWSAIWVPNTPFYDLPNISSIKKTKDFQQNGVTVLEVVLDCQDFVPKVGALGDAYHAIAPGWLAPTRNYSPPGRPAPGWEASEWAPEGESARIMDGVIVRVWQGFGEPETDVDSGACPPVDGGSNGAWTFRGMIDDVDIDGNPNQITITARNGKLLTDQRVFRASKSVQLKDPITFYDRLDASQESMVGSGANASSQLDGSPARNVLDPPYNCYDLGSPAYRTSWKPDGPNPAALEWIEIRLPAGSYDEFWLAAPGGLDAYVGVYARADDRWHSSPTGGAGLTPQSYPPTLDGREIGEGWVDVGHGDAPDLNGGWSYLRRFTTSEKGIDRVSLWHSLELGRHSILRVGLVDPSALGQTEVRDLHGLRRLVQRDIERQEFILVDDASEVVKVVLRWAGYTQWDVEEAGVRLSDGTNYGPGVVAKAGGRLTFNRTKFLVEIIQEVAKQLGFVFFIADPIDANTLDGIPTFRRDCSLMKGNRHVAADLNERTMLTGLKVKHTDEDKAFIIRVRGKTAAAADGGLPLGGDAITRIMAVYFPPWAGGSDGGVLRHIVYQDDQLITYAMCLYGCFMIAMQAALQMHTAIAEIPAHPMIELDDQVSVLDEPTGTNSRLWVVKTQDMMQLGETASWKQTLEGSLLDTEDLTNVIEQVLGRKSFSIGSWGPEGYVIDSINWRRVWDPSSGKTSGYTSPVVQGVSRMGRVR